MRGVHSAADGTDYWSLAKFPTKGGSQLTGGFCWSFGVAVVNQLLCQSTKEVPALSVPFSGSNLFFLKKIQR